MSVIARVYAIFVSNLQSSDYTACNQTFQPSDDDINNGSYPDKLPVPPLNYASPKGDNNVDSTIEEKSPDGSKPPDIRWIVQIVRRSSPEGKWPVQ